MNKKTSDSLEKVINYILDTEGDSFDEYLRDGGEPEGHVLYHAKKVQVWLRKQK